MLKFYHPCELLRLRWKTFTWRGGRTLWVNSLPSPHMSKWHSLSLCLQGFLCKVFLFSSVKMHLFPQVTFKIFTLSLVISSLNIKCLVMWVFFLLVFILLGVPWASWTYSWMSVPNKKKLQLLLLQIFLFSLFSLCSTFGILIMCMLRSLILSHNSWILCSLFFSCQFQFG